MYSDMSTRMSAFSSPNRYSASVRASSVLPTPVGPRKMNEPTGRLASLSPARERRMARDTALTASSWPMIRPCSASSMRASFADSFSSSLLSGIPVQRETMNSMSSSPTDWVPLPLFFSQSRFISSSRARRIFSFSRSEAAFSNSWASRYMSFSRMTRSSSFSISLSSAGGAGTDQRVQLVQEEHHVLGLADLLHHRLQALLELAAVLRAGHEGAEVELQEALVHEHVGHVVGHDLLREALDDGRLAHARLADEHRVVLRPPRQA